MNKFAEVNSRFGNFVGATILSTIENISLAIFFNVPIYNNSNETLIHYINRHGENFVDYKDVKLNIINNLMKVYKKSSYKNKYTKNLLSAMKNGAIAGGYNQEPKWIPDMSNPVEVDVLKTYPAYMHESISDFSNYSILLNNYIDINDLNFEPTNIREQGLLNFYKKVLSTQPTYITDYTNILESSSFYDKFNQIVLMRNIYPINDNVTHVLYYFCKILIRKNKEINIDIDTSKYTQSYDNTSFNAFFTQMTYRKPYPIETSIANIKRGYLIRNQSEASKFVCTFLIIIVMFCVIDMTIAAIQQTESFSPSKFKKMSIDDKLDVIRSSGSDGIKITNTLASILDDELFNGFLTKEQSSQMNVGIYQDEANKYIEESRYLFK